METSLTPAERKTANELIAKLGITQGKILRLQALPYNTAVQELEALKDEVSKTHRQLAKKYHPDQGGDVRIMQLLNDIVTEFKDLKIVPIRPAPPPTIIFYSGSSTTSSTSATGFGYTYVVNF
jgi:hypothetical protein